MNGSWDARMHVIRLLVSMALCSLLAACGGSSGNSSSAAGNDPPPTQQDVVSISGSPATTLLAGQRYSFAPTASDSLGGVLTFSVSNAPAWASFDSSTGQLSGTPSDAQTGTYADIVISAGDGSASAALAPFTITVAGPQPGSATLSWVAPTENEDGTELTNLAGYNIYYGTSADALNQMINLPEVGQTSYVLSGLQSGNTYYFSIAAYNTVGISSSMSEIVSKEI
jgi:Putative Ig domain